MKKKGFTLIELLVVIAIIAMLLAILMPALGKVKRLAERLVCGTNLKGMGTAHNTYAFDYDDEFAVQGGKTNRQWGTQTSQWFNVNLNWNDSSDTSEISVGGSLYLLVREADVDPKSFVCRGGGEKAFEGAGPEDNSALPANMDIVDFWDFGSTGVNMGPQNCLSYSYQQPYEISGYAPHPASGSSGASMPIMADKNPWHDSKLVKSDVASVTQDNWQGFVGLIDAPNGIVTKNPKYMEQIGNSNAHSREGQNVLYGDGHVEWVKGSAVGVEEDNIYTNWASAPGATPVKEQKVVGAFTGALGTGLARTATDAVLVNDIMP